MNFPCFEHKTQIPNERVKEIINEGTTFDFKKLKVKNFFTRVNKKEIDILSLLMDIRRKLKEFSFPNYEYRIDFIKSIFKFLKEEITLFFIFGE